MNNSTCWFNSSWLSNSSFLMYGVSLNDERASAKVFVFLISLGAKLHPSTQGVTSHESVFLRCRLERFPSSSMISFHVASRVSFWSSHPWISAVTACFSNFAAVSPAILSPPLSFSSSPESNTHDASGDESAPDFSVKEEEETRIMMRMRMTLMVMYTYGGDNQLLNHTQMLGTLQHKMLNMSEIFDVGFNIRTVEMMPNDNRACLTTQMAIWNLLILLELDFQNISEAMAL